MENIAILGAGNGGLSMGAYLSLKGCRVNLYDKFFEVIAPIQERGGVHLKGVSLNGFASFNTVSTDIGEVIEGCGLIMIVTPAFAHKEIAEKCGGILKDGQIIVLHPGRTGGALEFYNILKSNNPGVNVNIAETQTLIYASRRTGPVEAVIYGIKNKVSVAAIPSRNTRKVVQKLNNFYKEFVPAENVLETSLLNIGAVFHPVPSIFNIARIEASDDFEYYHQGISPSIAMVLTKVDEERVRVAAALGVKTLSALQWLKEVYGVSKGDIKDAVYQNKVYSGIMAPKNRFARYITEDVPMSLTPISELGRLVKVKTPVIDMIIEIASIMHETDYRSSGRTLGRMGIEGLTPEEIIQYIS